MSTSPKAAYLQWRRGPSVGCAFARYLTRRPEDYGQRVVTISSNGSPERIAGLIVRRVQSLVDDPLATAAILLMPQMPSIKHLAQTAIALGRHPGWATTSSLVVETPIGEVVALHVTNDVPFNEHFCPSEVLMFGPYGQFPTTRRAPVAACELYVGAPRQSDPKSGAPTIRANLAHLSVDLPTQRAFDAMMLGSARGRLRALEHKEDKRAKAKVSMTISKAMARELGCLP